MYNNKYFLIYKCKFWYYDSDIFILLYLICQYTRSAFPTLKEKIGWMA